MALGILGPFEVDDLDRWFDVTDQIVTDGDEYALLRDPEAGVLMLSGFKQLQPESEADTRPEALVQQILEENERLLENVIDPVATYSTLRIGAVSHSSDGIFLRVWKFSDGRYVADALYTCTLGKEETELADCEAIIRSIKFREAAG